MVVLWPHPDLKRQQVEVSLQLAEITPTFVRQTDVQRVAEKYLLTSNRTIGVLSWTTGIGVASSALLRIVNTTLVSTSGTLLLFATCTTRLGKAHLTRNGSKV